MFGINPHYWVAVYANLEIGSDISQVQSFGDPQELKFQDGSYNATATLNKVGESLVLVLSN